MLAVFVTAAWFAAAGQQPTSPIRTGALVRKSALAPPWCENPLSHPENPLSHPGSPDGVQTFAEGVRVDWPKLTVEVDAEVVLREGPLELFACSPKTREHESILSVSARPLHIYQALGLIGLTPGKPLRFDEEAKRWEEPRGDRLELRVRYTDERGTHIVASEQWVSYAKGLNPARPTVLDWVFAGSTNQPDGRFAADADGTIACLVDFESALIALGSRHTADNADLWLIANTTQIPPRGTKCVLLIRSNNRPAVEVDMLDEHTVRVGERSLTAGQLAKMLRPPPDDARPGRLYIHPAANVSDEAAKAFVEKVIQSGFEGVIETKRRPPKKQAAPPD
jgi:hypothetical protein